MGGMRPPEGDQAGPREGRWHSAMCDYVRSMGSSWCGRRGLRPHCKGLNWSCGISKPTSCLKLESLPTMRVQQSAIRPLAEAKRVLQDAVSRQNVGSGKDRDHACSATQQSGLVEAGFHLGRERVGGWVQKERKRGQALKACPLLKGLKQKQPRGRRFNQD